MNRGLLAEFAFFAVIGALIIYVAFKYLELPQSYSYLVAFVYGFILYWFVVIKRGEG